MALVYKEICFLKAQMSRLLFLLAVLLGVAAYFYFFSNLGFMVTFFGLYISGILAVMQILQNSISSEKLSHMLEKNMTRYSLQKILLIKCAFAAIAGSLMSLVCGTVSYQMEGADTGWTFFYSLILAFLVNSFLSMIYTLLYLFINQIILMNIITTALVLILAMVNTQMQAAEDILGYMMKCGVILAGINLLAGLFIKFIPTDKVLN